MSFWVVRAGKHGETENYALEKNIVAIGWDDLENISGLNDRETLQQVMNETYPDENIGTTRVWTGEVWAFKERIQEGDLVALPLKSRAAIAVGRVRGAYSYIEGAPQGAKHQRAVEWLRKDLPRAELDQDLLYSLGSILAVFRVQRNRAEERVTALLKGQARPANSDKKRDIEEPDQEQNLKDIEQIAADQIVDFISRKFRGHDLTRLVAGVLIAEGYQVFVSPPGADGGVDIIAGTGAMGFEKPRLAVQVKSSDTPADVGIVRELQGVMPRFGADQGLVVSWGGFKDSVLREARQLYFTLRLWDAGHLVAAIQKNYQKLSPELQTELPLKQVWTLVLD